jgi:hypothetical protein
VVPARLRRKETKVLKIRSGFWKWVKDYSQGVVSSAAPFPMPAEASVVEMPNNTTLALLCDWATGTDEAAGIASLVKSHNPELMPSVPLIMNSAFADKFTEYQARLIANFRNGIEV